MLKNSEVAEEIRRTAYFLWDHDGQPEGRAFEYWLKAKDIYLRRLAYDKWLADGAPIGHDDDYWRDATDEFGDR